MGCMVKSGWIVPSHGKTRYLVFYTHYLPDDFHRIL